jgi:hypothetical protein
MLVSLVREVVCVQHRLSTKQCRDPSPGLGCSFWCIPMFNNVKSHTNLGSRILTIFIVEEIVPARAKGGTAAASTATATLRQRPCS